MVYSEEMWKWLNVEMNDPDGSGEKCILKTFRRIHNDETDWEAIELGMQSKLNPEVVRIRTMKPKGTIRFKHIGETVMTGSGSAQQRALEGHFTSGFGLLIETECLGRTYTTKTASRDLTISQPTLPDDWQGTALWFRPLGPSATTPTVHSRPSLRVTNFADPMTLAWPNWAKIFFNRGVAAKETDNCANYPRVTNPCGTGECGSSHVSRQPCAPGSPRRSDSDVRRPPRPNSVPVVPERHGRKCAATPAGSYPRRRSSG